MPLPFLKNYATPCWYELRPPGGIHKMYQNNCVVKHWKSFTRMSERALQKYLRQMELLEKGMGQWKGRDWRLRCLPAILFLGPDKCGSTDLIGRLSEHTLLRHPAYLKEIRYWSNFRETCKCLHMLGILSTLNK